MLGIGGMHALEAVGLSPTVCHMNEGHSAFLALERIGRVMRERARDASPSPPRPTAPATSSRPTRPSPPATTPSPRARAPLPRAVPRGARHHRSGAPGARAHRPARRERDVLDAGPRDAHRRSLQRRERAPRRGLAQDVAGPLARSARSTRSPSTSSPTACTPRRGSRRDGRALHALPRAALGRAARRRRSCWQRAYEIPDAELWQVHEHRRHRLVQHARRWLHAAAPSGAARSATRSSCADEVLDPHALTIGFARRFATYKRAALLFSDLDAREEAPRRRRAPGAARLRGQGAPAGQGRQGAHSLDHPRQPRRRAPRARRLHRGLRHAHRARAGQRRRRVAQHAAPPARGERHERDEGGRQRRAQR